MGRSQALWQAFAASARREAARLWHSPWDLAMISWLPLLGVALVWWIFSAGLPNQLPIGVMDHDHSSLSRQLVRFLDATPGLKVVRPYSDTAHASAGLRRAEVVAVVSIPPDFARTVKRGQAAQVTLLHNAQLGTHSGLIQRDVRTVVGTLSAGVEMAARNKRGEPKRATLVSREPIKTSLMTLFNPSLNYEQFLAIALIPALLHILAMTAGACAVGQELRDATIAPWLANASAGRAATLGALLGKLLWPLLGLGGVGLLAMLGMTWGRGWHPPGSLAWVLLALTIFLALSIALGAFAAAASRSLRAALSATGFITAPAFAFGGVGFPLQSMPPLARGWAELLPYTHYIRLQMEQVQMNAPLHYSVPTLVGLGGLTVALLLACVPLLRSATAKPACWGRR